MQFRPHAQQKIIRGLKLLALGFGHEFIFLQIAQRTRAVFEKRHPQQILKIAQAAAAVLDVRLLHRGGVADIWSRRVAWSSSRAAMYFSSKPTTHLLTTVFLNLLNNASLPIISRDSMSDVLDCMSVLATFTQSFMSRTE